MSAKIQFSPQEKDLMTDTGWILTKQNITEKIYALFAELYDYQKQQIKNIPFLSSQIFTSSGKIYKGENYLGLPYIILDHPAIFKKENLFVVRTMFWWGNFFSVTLHTYGEHKYLLQHNKKQTLQFLQQKQFYICVHDHQWQHHFKKDNYTPATNFSLPEFEKIMEKDFFKIAKKLPVTKAGNAYDFLTAGFDEIIEMINFNCQGGEKDLSPVSPTTGSGL